MTAPYVIDDTETLEGFHLREQLQRQIRLPRFRHLGYDIVIQVLRGRGHRGAGTRGRARGRWKRHPWYP